MEAACTCVQASPLSASLILKPQSNSVGNAGDTSVTSSAKKETQRYADLFKIIGFSFKTISYLQVQLGKTLMLQMGPYFTGDQPGPSAELSAGSQCKAPIHPFLGPGKVGHHRSSSCL